MTETHVTSNTATPERVTNEDVVTPPKRDRAAYMRDYRAKQSNKSNGSELNLAPVDNKPAELNTEAAIPVEHKSAEQYHEQISQADEAALALKKQIEELRKSEQLNRQQAEQAARQQQQAAEAHQQLNNLFHFWQQSGLSPREEQALRTNPELMVRLTDFAMREASEHGHAVGSAEHVEATRKLFREHLAHLHDQAMASPQTTEPIAGNGHIPEAEPMHESDFFKPPPVKPMQPRQVPVSAPVSREVPSGVRRSEQEQDPSRVHLSVDEREIARASGISETEYARQKIRMQRMKASGEIV